MRSLSTRVFFIGLLILLIISCIPASSRAVRSSEHPAAHFRLTPFRYSNTCVNDKVTFLIDNTNGIATVQWDFGDPGSGSANTSANIRPEHTYTATGNYTVTLTVVRNGVQDITTQDITIVAPVPHDFGPQDMILCEGQTAVLNAPVIPGATYLWQDSSTGSSIVVDTTTTYKVKINGCLVPDSVNAFFTPIPELELGDDHTLCLGESIRLDATSQNSTYQWNTGETTSTIVVTQSGRYEVQVNAAGCGTYTDAVTINIAGGPYPPFSLGPDTLLCPGESVTLTPNVPGATRYTWSTGSRAPSVTIRNPADVWVFVQIDNTCEVLDTIGVRFNALRNINLGNDTTICKGEFLVLTANYGQGSYRWQDGSEQATFYVRQQGIYYVRAQIGRCISSDTIMVRYDDTLRVNLGPDTVLCKQELLKLYPAGAGGNFKWQDSTNVPVYTVTQPGIYALVANNTCGRAVDSVTVSYKDCECQLYLPTAFSPNNDGKNDVFRPVYRCLLADYQLSVYNRWGERVFFTTDPQLAWTGYKNGNPIDVGTYVWILDYKSADTRQPVHKTGTVTVVY